ncbi:helix-turn-helix transcriptional regulator [Prauserella endophytica]|uniref:Helix-turn-helix transcriptional regulator n=1 Tax=Prauserella endophytica TaxID=1592324 RepID=A0ABY2S0Z8_9PSEU|nr:helix-turn-helix transcriptional regulator [Prauserella endophytica]TKG68346.1 helix-turn-helix transcriptional regulator [Prauserella endophytica]
MPTRRRGLAAARKSAGHTQESLAAALKVDRSTVIRWEAGDYAPLPYLRPKLARLLQQTPEQLRNLIDVNTFEAPASLSPDVDAACGWLDEQLGWTPGTSAWRVTARLPKTRRELPARRARRARVPRSQVTSALKAYYGDDPDYFAYTANVAGREIETSILTRPDWLDVQIPLTAETEHITLVQSKSYDSSIDIEPEPALDRLAEVEVSGIRLTNEPIYRLLSAAMMPDGIHATVGLADFAEYALTMDLLENELLDALAEKRTVERGSLPLRDRYLPTITSVIDLPSRLCAGGIVALSAIARPAGPHRDADYALLVQERSALVVNATQQLTVIPKGFHQPLTDYEADTSLRTTLLREIEEELFGRSDLDSTIDSARAISPMHPRRMSEPMQWLTSQEAGYLRLDSTGLGLNLVSGNFEFSCLAAIDAPTFWSRFAGHIEANWETKGLRSCSSRDDHALTHLLTGKSWNNEGLFAFCQGLDRLQVDRT